MQRSCWINFANIDPRAYRLQIQPVSPFYLHAHLEKLKQTHFAKVNEALVYLCFPDWLQKCFTELTNCTGVTKPQSCFFIFTFHNLLKVKNEHYAKM